MKVMDISGRSENIISRNLSNMTLHEFMFRGFAQRSAESVIQSLKYKNPYQQMYALTLAGFEAKREGLKTDWREDQKLFWFGAAMRRDGFEYQQFLDELYISLLRNKDFKQYLIQTEGCKLTHIIGVSNPRETVLTEFEFCNRLTCMRDYILANKEYSEQGLKQRLRMEYRKYLNKSLTCFAMGTVLEPSPIIKKENAR